MRPQRTPGLALGDDRRAARRHVRVRARAARRPRRPLRRRPPHPQPRPGRRPPQRAARRRGRRSGPPWPSGASTCSARAPTAQIRACTGSSVCALGITDCPGRRPAPAGSAALAPELVAAGLRVGLPQLVRPAPGRRHRPGRVEGPRRRHAPPTATRSTWAPTSTSHAIGEVVGRVADDDLDAAVDADRRHLGGPAPPRRVAGPHRRAASAADAFVAADRGRSWPSAGPPAPSPPSCPSPPSSCPDPPLTTFPPRDRPLGRPISRGNPPPTHLVHHR